jgi:hypothetical protein
MFLYDFMNRGAYRHMTGLWEANERLMEGLWKAYRHMTGLWEAYERLMEGLWEAYRHMTGVWEAYERPMEGLWEAYERNQTGTTRNQVGTKLEPHRNQRGTKLEPNRCIGILMYLHIASRGIKFFFIYVFIWFYESRGITFLFYMCFYMILCNY